jgi:hypothetical protein
MRWQVFTSGIYQVFTSLVYGAKGLLCFNYWSPTWVAQSLGEAIVDPKRDIRVQNTTSRDNIQWAH